MASIISKSKMFLYLFLHADLNNCGTVLSSPTCFEHPAVACRCLASHILSQTCIWMRFCPSLDSRAQEASTRLLKRERELPKSSMRNSRLQLMEPSLRHFWMPQERHMRDCWRSPLKSFPNSSLLSLDLFVTYLLVFLFSFVFQYGLQQILSAGPARAPTCKRLPHLSLWRLQSSKDW